MPVIHVDGQAYEVREGANLLEACLSHGKNLPYFCWHPALGSVGACRQCAVLQYANPDDQRGRLVMACMTPASEGARISIAADSASGFREAVIESLMLNHPHDCPVCEEGGECHLQDMTVMSGHTFRRYDGAKRTFRNQDLGPFITHEMNRCITCYRCVRYYRDYAGGTDLQAFGSRNRMFFGRFADGTLESEFSGNLVEVCPTGVFADKPFAASYTRKWDLESAPSLCPGCAVGCNTSPGARYGQLKRIHNRYHPEVNGYFLCDRGRFGGHFANLATRLVRAGARAANGSFDELSATDAAARLGALVSAGGMLGIGSPRASLETNFALRALVGEDNFAGGLAATDGQLARLTLDLYRAYPGRIASLRDIESADAVLVLGEDVANTAPRVALALRQSVRNRAFELAADADIPLWQDAGVRGHAQHARSPLFLALPAASRIDDIARGSCRRDPVSIARIGFAIAHALNPDLAEVAGLDEVESRFVSSAAAALSGAQRPLVVAGSQLGLTVLPEAAAAVAGALAANNAAAALNLNVPECNSLGAAWLDGGPSVDAVLQQVAAGTAPGVIVAENNLLRRADAALVRAAFAAGTCVVLDVLENPCAELAALVLPAASWSESEGTWVSSEARAQHFFQVQAAPGDAAPTWRWLARAARAAGRNDLAWETTDALTAACAREVPGLAALAGAAPGDDYRAPGGVRLPRQPHRYSGRTAMTANVSVHEPKTRVDDDSPLAFSMEGMLPPDAPVLPFVWSPGWNSNQAISRFQQEINGPLRGGDGGVRLIEPAANGAPAARYQVPAPGPQALTLVPLPQVFGSDELTALSPPIRQRMPDAQLHIRPEDAARLLLVAGQGVKFAGMSMAVVVDAELAPGVVGYFSDLPGGPTAWQGGAVTVDTNTLVADPDYVPPARGLIAKG